MGSFHRDATGLCITHYRTNYCSATAVPLHCLFLCFHLLETLVRSSTVVVVAVVVVVQRLCINPLLAWLQPYSSDGHPGWQAA